MSSIVHNRIESFVVDQNELQVKLNELYPQAVVDQQVIDQLTSSEPVSYFSYLKEYELKNHDRSYELILADFAKSCLAAGKTHKAFAFLTDAIRQDVRASILPGVPDTLKECLETSAILGRLVPTNLCNTFWKCCQKYSKL